MAAPDIKEIHAIFRVDPDHHMHRVVAAMGGDGVVRSAIDVERLARRLARIGAEPLVLEVIPGLGRRPLLVERRPVARKLRRLLVAQKAGVDTGRTGGVIGGSE